MHTSRRKMVTVLRLLTIPATCSSCETNSKSGNSSDGGLSTILIIQIAMLYGI